MEMFFSIFCGIVDVLRAIYSSIVSRQRRRLYLTKAVYYHAKRSQEIIKEYDFGQIRKNISNDATYTPLLPRSLIDDELTYSQMIEVLEYLCGNEENETVIMTYFYKHVQFHSLVFVFSLEIVGNSWTQQRKLDLLTRIENSAADMSKHAEKTKEILKKILGRRLTGKLGKKVKGTSD